MKFRVRGSCRIRNSEFQNSEMAPLQTPLYFAINITSLLPFVSLLLLSFLLLLRILPLLLLLPVFGGGGGRI